MPPEQPLVERGLAKNLVGYNIFSAPTEGEPRADLIQAVERGHVDVAVAWGPIAGYFARHAAVPLDVTPIEPDAQHPSLPLAFEIGIGLRTEDGELKQRLNAELEKRRPEIHRLLETYGIPQNEVRP